MQQITNATRGNPDSYHYEQCQCQNDTKLYTEIDQIWDKPTKIDRKPLKIDYYIPHLNLTGGMKMIVEQIRHLKERGHYIRALYKGTSSRALPPWTDVKVDEEIIIQPGSSFYLYLDQCDVMVIGYFTQLQEIIDIMCCPGPILYWEQGSEHLFADSTAPLYYDVIFHRSMRLPLSLASVSNIIQRTLYEQFERTSYLIPNGIDTSKFHPRLPKESPIDYTKLNIKEISPTNKYEPKYKILLVGNGYLPFKNFITALQVIQYLNEQYKVHVTWICQQDPTGLFQNFNYYLRLIIDPPQLILPALYRDNYDLFLFSSIYESFALPVIEAMASGIPIITSKCGGVDDYCHHEYNCLMAEPTNIQQYIDHIITIFNNPSLSQSFIKNGLETVKKYSWDEAMISLEDCLYHVSEYLQQKLTI